MNREYWPAAFYSWVFTFLLLSCSNGASDASSGAPSTEEERQKRIEEAVPAGASDDLYLRAGAEIDMGTLIERIERHLDDKNLSYAKAHLDKAMEMDSLNEEVQWLSGRFHLAANQSKKANDIWRKCGLQHPENIPCRIELTRLQLTIGLVLEALKTANELIEIDRNNAEAYFLKGLAVRAVKENDDDALPYFQRAVDLDNAHLDALDMLGVIYAGRKDSLALAYYRNILALQPDRSDIYFKIGVFHMDKQEWNEAMGAYERAIRIDPKDADSYYNLGFVLTQIRVYDKARNAFAQAIAVRPRNFKAYYGRGYTHEMLGDLTNAARDYREALSIRPKHQPSATALGRVNQKLNAVP